MNEYVSCVFFSSELIYLILFDLLNCNMHIDEHVSAVSLLFINEHIYTVSLLFFSEHISVVSLLFMNEYTGCPTKHDNW